MHRFAQKRSTLLHFLQGLLLCGCAYSMPANALIFAIASVPPELLFLQIGRRGGRIDEVRFNVPANQLGSGAPVAGNRAIRILMVNRAQPAFSRIATLTADSSMPLQNGASSIPFSSISWQARVGHIPSGAFNGTSNQSIISFPNSHIILDYHRYYYANSQILEAGSYDGRVTYTLTMP